MNLKQYAKLVHHDREIIFYDNIENDIVKLEDLVQLVSEEKARENFDESTLTQFTPIKIICADCGKKVLLYADPCEIHKENDKKCNDLAYRCVECETLNNDWLVCSLVYGKKAIKLIDKDPNEAKNLIKYLDDYWFKTVILK